MTSISKDAVRGKAADTAEERDFLLNVFRTAAAKSRLATSAIETIGISLRQKQIDCEGALAWAKDERVFHHLVMAPPSQGGGQ